MLKVGFIGIGRIAKIHLSSIESIEGMDLVAVCDIKKSALSKFENSEVRTYVDYKEMINSEDLDLVVIATPNGLHYEMGMYAIQHGKNILMEKPIALNSIEAQKLIEAAEKKDVHFFAVKQVRYNPSIQIVKQYVDNGSIGKIFSVNLTVNWTRPEEYYKNSEWRGTLKLDGGTLLNQGIHYIDIVQWIVGRVKEVFGKVDTVAHNIEIEDEAFAVLTFENGAYGTISVNMNTYPRNIECSITILGTQGSIKLSGSAMNKIEFWEVKNVPEPQIPEGFAPNVYAGGMYQGSCPNHLYVYQDIFKQLTTGGGKYISGKDALHSIEIVEAIYKSSKENNPIKIISNN